MDPTRSAAFALVSAVLDRRRPLEDALDALPAMAARDRAAGHRLAASVLRRLGTLDAVLEPFLVREPPVAIRHVLRLGAAGLLLLDTPAHAAVATAVALARALRLAPFAGLVNAVLRRVATAGATVLDGLDGPRLDTPPWLWTAWGQDARAIAEAHGREAPLDLSLRRGATAPPGAEILPTGSARLPPGTNPVLLPGFAEGAFWVQDAAATLPARLLHAAPGERVADLCAAPGGKTAQLADAGAQVAAIERDPGRLARLHDNIARLRMTVDEIRADALTWAAPVPLDAVLLDAPCTATGTIRRHPDILRVKRGRDVAALAVQQAALLAAAAGMLRPGGRLVYAVCSLLPAEGAAVAARGLAAGLVPDPVRLDEMPGLEDALTAEGHVRTSPAMWRERGGLDGFFVARFRKSG